mgnify:CR=1 FL=1
MSWENKLNKEILLSKSEGRKEDYNPHDNAEKKIG